MRFILIGEAYYRNRYVETKGLLRERIDIEKKHCSMIHDFVLTKHYLIIFDCPVVLDMNQLVTGGSVANWRPELGSRIGLISLKDGKVRWIDTEAFFVFHFANTYEIDNQIIIDYVRFETFDFLSKDSDESNMFPVLYRTTINLDSWALKHTQLDDRIVEFPRIRDENDTLPHPFIYTPTRKAGMDTKQG